MKPKRIELNGKNWIDSIEEHLKKESEREDPFSGFVWRDNRFDYAYGSEHGIAGDVDLEYDSVSVRPVEIVLPRQWPVIDPYDDGHEIETPEELMATIQDCIIAEFPVQRGGDEYPDLRLTCGFQTIQDFGKNIQDRPLEILVIKPEWEEA